MMAVDSTGEVVAVRPLAEAYFLLEANVGGMTPAKPGEFVMVGVASRPEPFLRRAFSVYDQRTTSDGSLVIQLLGKVIGRGTEALASCTSGERLHVLGPLGEGFRGPGADGLGSKSSGPGVDAPRAALVAGGVGSAGLGLLARTLGQRGRPFDVFLGGRSAPDLVEARTFARLSAQTGGRLVCTTEDGTEGLPGLVTTAFEAALRVEGRGYTMVYTCGPHGLMAAVARIAAAAGVPGEAATEAAMGCGYGACLGCVVPMAKGGLALCCRQGPVFALDDVAW